MEDQFRKRRNIWFQERTDCPDRPAAVYDYQEASTGHQASVAFHSNRSRHPHGLSRPSGSRHASTHPPLPMCGRSHGFTSTVMCEQIPRLSPVLLNSVGATRLSQPPPDGNDRNAIKNGARLNWASPIPSLFSYGLQIVNGCGAGIGTAARL
jgi:hypothetical protein